MRQRIFILLSISTLLQFGRLSAQEVGAELVGNPQTESFGLGFRANIPVSSILISPQFAYYPSFNKVSEYYLGASAHVGIFGLNNSVIYGLANVSYNSWLNYEDSPMKKAHKANLGLEAGIGITGKRCVKPFGEFRYNVKWRETNLRIGILIDLSCKGSGSGYHNSGERKAVNCPGH